MNATPNTPTPGTPEWLRDEAKHRECRGDPQEIPDGLRAAAERIEQLMRKIAQQEDWWEQMHEYREQLEESERKREALKAEVACANRGAKSHALLAQDLYAKTQELRAALEKLEKAKDDLLLSLSGEVSDNCELRDTIARLRAENEALRKDKERLDWLLERGAVGHFSEWRDAEGGKERTLFRLHSRAAIDAARKEGA